MTEQTRYRFSVVIPTHQRKDLVLDSVRALHEQPRSTPFEVVVVVDGSTDGSASALRELETPFPLLVVEQAHRGQAAARNAGSASARGELLLFLDDDMEAHPELLHEHDRSHREGADVVIGHIPLHPDSTPGFLSAAVGAWAESRKESLAQRGGALHLDDLLSGQMSVRRDLFLQVGCFDTTFTREGAFGGEDIDLGRRLLDAGARIVFNPEAISRQRYVVPPRQYLRQWRQVGRANVLLARRHPDYAETIFRRRQSRVDRFVGRPLGLLLRELVLVLAAVGLQGPRIARWFFRVRSLEYFRGIREAGGEPAPRAVRVLCYHVLSDLAGEPVIEAYGVPPETFDRHLSFLARRFHLISADEFVRYLNGGGVPRRAVLLTFDDCYEDLVNVALPRLRELHARAIAFAVTGRIGGTNDWDAPLGARQLRLLDANGLRVLTDGGVAIGSHGRTHRRLDRLSHEDLAAEIDGSLADLEALALPRPLLLAYPHGTHNPAVKSAARSAGLVGAFTVQAGLVRPDGDAFEVPRIEILRSDHGWRFAWKVFTAGRLPTRSGRR
jgi:glycosyltransferase involved in cell wall biosynthesis/peptidoglycan/xylan/chitin deacetylase (PgdA/CDA1 family)